MFYLSDDVWQTGSGLRDDVYVGVSDWRLHDRGGCAGADEPGQTGGGAEDRTTCGPLESRESKSENNGRWFYTDHV